MTNKIFSRIGIVTVSNIFKLITNILVGFIVPKILGVTDYGYYKTFTLYLTYIGIFHFGFIDGIYLKYGGHDYKDLDKKQFRMYFKFLIIVELVVSLIGVFASLKYFADEKKFIFILLFINLLSINITTYFQFISQFTNRFKEYSLRIIILSIMNIVSIVVISLLDNSNYRIYISMIVIMNYLLTLWYIFTYRDIIFGKSNKIRQNTNSIKEKFSIGLPLLISNLSSTLVLTVDKQFVEIFYELDIFSYYSFAYSMLAMITVVISSIAVVLYPFLKRITLQKVKEIYSDLNSIILIIVFIGISVFFPLTFIINNFLPEYNLAISIFRIALPGIAITSSITAIKQNYYKILGLNKRFFVVSICTLILSIFADYFIQIIYSNYYYITWISIVILLLWYIFSDILLLRIFRFKILVNLSYIVIMSIVFYYISFYFNSILGLFLYFGSFLIITSLFFANKIKVYLNMFKGSKV